MPATLSVDSISKVFPGRAGGPPLEALRAVSFSAQPGEFVSLIGPSGCGKTTLFITHNMDEAIFFSDRILVFGTRPGRIIEEVKVPFARPRTVEVVRASRQFGELREHLWALLSQELAA